MRWIVGITKPNSEPIAKENLLRQGFDCYYPLYEQRLPNKPPRIRPLFPRYVFILIDRVWYCLRNTRGMASILMGEGGPGQVPTSIIDNLRGRENEKGLYQLARKSKFQVGDKLKALKGPFTGSLCVYEGMSPHDRVNVLMDMLGMKVSVELEESALAAA